MIDAALARFGADYARHRAAEGRGYEDEQLLSLPYLREGPFARQWAVRARSFDTLVRRVIRPMARSLGRPLTLLDLGAGNGWLSSRVAAAGHEAVAIDIRDDSVDGLGAAAPLIARAHGRMRCMVASFGAVPLPDHAADIVLFNASLHYALDLRAVLGEAVRLAKPAGIVAILDSPFYRRAADGEAMVREKQAQAQLRFGARAGALLSLPFIEYLTRQSLETDSSGLALTWRRLRVRYPLWYELRPLLAAVRRRRAPSRFDLWIGARR